MQDFFFLSFLLSLVILQRNKIYLKEKKEGEHESNSFGHPCGKLGLCFQLLPVILSGFSCLQEFEGVNKSFCLSLPIK